MPGATLTIEPGVEMEFYPGVGILVLGTMHAQGNLERNIIMRPVELQNVQDYRWRSFFYFKLELKKENSFKLFNLAKSQENQIIVGLHQYVLINQPKGSFEFVYLATESQTLTIRILE